MQYIVMADKLHDMHDKSRVHDDRFRRWVEWAFGHVDKCCLQAPNGNPVEHEAVDAMQLAAVATQQVDRGEIEAVQRAARESRLAADECKRYSHEMSEMCKKLEVMLVSERAKDRRHNDAMKLTPVVHVGPNGHASTVHASTVAMCVSTEAEAARTQQTQHTA